MVESTEYISSKAFENIYTLKSMYDQNSIAIVDMFGNRYRIKMDQLFELFYQNNVMFELDKPEINDKRRKHTYLKFKEIE